MAVSKLQILNVALNILGVAIPIEISEKKDTRYVLLNNYYELARDYVLKDFDWNFASTFRELSLYNLKNTDDTYLNYEYCYSYPNNCICARDIFEKGGYVLNKFYIHSLDDDRKVILTNVDNAVLRYTRRVEKENFFSVEFSLALAYYLASMTASVLVGSLQKGEVAFQKYSQLIRHAKYLNAQEGTDNIYSDDTYLDKRG